MYICLIVGIFELKMEALPANGKEPMELFHKKLAKYNEPIIIQCPPYVMALQSQGVCDTLQYMCVV